MCLQCLQVGISTQRVNAQYLSVRNFWFFFCIFIKFKDVYIVNYSRLCTHCVYVRVCVCYVCLSKVNKAEMH